MSLNISDDRGSSWSGNTLVDSAIALVLSDSSSTSGGTTQAQGINTIAQAQTFQRSAPPAAAAQGIAAITGNSPDLSQLEFYQIDRWSNVGSIRPPLSDEGVQALSQSQNLFGTAFIDGSRYGAIVESSTIDQVARRYGVTRQQMSDFAATQELAHAYFSKNYPGDPNSPEYRKKNELFGEAASATVNPEIANLQAMAYLAWDRKGANAGYDGYLDIAETSLNDTLRQSGFTEVDGKTPAQQFTEGLFEAWKAAGSKPFHEVYDEYVDSFVQKNAPDGSNINPDQLQQTIQSNYVGNLTSAARDLF